MIKKHIILIACCFNFVALQSAQHPFNKNQIAKIRQLTPQSFASQIPDADINSVSAESRKNTDKMIDLSQKLGIDFFDLMNQSDKEIRQLPMPRGLKQPQQAQWQQDKKELIAVCAQSVLIQAIRILRQTNPNFVYDSKRELDLAKEQQQKALVDIEERRCQIQNAANEEIRKQQNEKICKQQLTLKNMACKLRMPVTDIEIMTKQEQLFLLAGRGKNIKRLRSNMF